MCCKELAPLLQLPDSCLVAVLRCCAGDTHSVCRAARAHSRLHQAAVQALSSITLVTDQQQRLDDLQLYLSQHGRHVSSLNLRAPGHVWRVALWELPRSLQLSSLTCENVHLQLLPGYGYQGVLRGGAAPPLKQLRLKQCRPIDEPTAVSAALAQLTDLEHLSISEYGSSGREFLVLHALQHLTFLELDVFILGNPAVQCLSALTRLVDLRLQTHNTYSVSANTMSGLQRLTRLQLATSDRYGTDHGHVSVEPAALSGKTGLQHLELCKGRIAYGAAGEGQLLAHVGELQQLAYLSLCDSLIHHAAPPGSDNSAAAYSALTASSKLQHLNIECCMPAQAWEHMLPAGKQLPHLRTLYASCLPDITHLASCCPGLQSVRVGRGAVRNLQELVALASSSGRHGLVLGDSGSSAAWRGQRTGVAAGGRRAAAGAGGAPGFGHILEAMLD